MLKSNTSITQKISLLFKRTGTEKTQPNQIKSNTASKLKIENTRTQSQALNSAFVLFVCC